MPNIYEIDVDDPLRREGAHGELRVPDDEVRSSGTGSTPEPRERVEGRVEQSDGE